MVDIRKDANAQHFYPRPPRGGRLRRRCSGPPRPHISIHALREEGDPRRRLKYHVSFISIHALREEGDSTAYSRRVDELISIHALREEGDPSVRCYPG